MSNRLFNNSELTDVEKTIKRGFGAIIVVWALGVIFSLALTGGIIYVAWHFISKIW